MERTWFKKQRILCKELKKTSSIHYNPSHFEHSQINFFDSRFSAKRLGILNIHKSL
jgi:hypothetical protein